MWADLKNLFLAILLIYGITYTIGFIYALIKHRGELVKEANKISNLDKGLTIYFLLLACIAFSGCSTTPKHIPSWRDAYQNRKPVTVVQGAPVYAEHVEYLNREVNYMCLAGIKPMLPVEFTNKQASDFCYCMTDRYYTPDQYGEILLKLDYNPNKVVLVFKEIQNEYWAVMDDDFKKNYREIVKYPPGYFERITKNRANCIDDINYKEYTKQGVTQE